jgi:hypothetical protein
MPDIMSQTKQAQCTNCGSGLHWKSKILNSVEFSAATCCDHSYLIRNYDRAPVLKGPFPLSGAIVGLLLFLGVAFISFIASDD